MLFRKNATTTAILLVLLAIAVSAPAATLPSTDFPLIDPRPGLAPYGRENVEIAASQDQFLAVWEDDRAFPALRRIFGTIIGGPGVVGNPLGFSIAPIGTSESGTRIQTVASDGTDFLVAFTTRGDLRFVKVTSEGVAGEVQRPGVAAEQVAIAWIGFSYAVFVTDPGSNGALPSSVRVFLVDRDGHAESSPSYVVASPAITSIAALTSADGNDAVLGWIDTADQAVHLHVFPGAALRNGQAPELQQITGLGSSSQLTGLGLATDGNEFFATWIESQGGGNTYRARRFTRSGGPTAPVFTLATAVDTNPLRPVVAWDGAEYTVTMRTRAGVGVQAGLYRADGSPIGAQPLLVGEGNVPDASVASTGRLSFFVWNEVRPGGSSQIYGDAVTSGGSLRYGPGQSTLLSRSKPDVTDVTVVWQGDHYLASWLETSDSTRAMIGRVTPNGVLLDGNGITVSAGARSSAPSLATDGSTAVVAWTDAAGVTIFSVDGAGHSVRVAGPFPAAIERPAVHWNGSQFAIFWQSAQRLTAIRLGRDGRPIELQPVTIGESFGAPVAGWTGTEYVVVTRSPSTACDPCFGSYDLFTQFVSSSLAAIGQRSSLANSFAGVPFVADGLSGALIVWLQNRSGGSTIFAARAAHGSLLDRPPIAIGRESETPTAFASGTGWEVVSGPYTFEISGNGTVGPRSTTFSFVPQGASSMVVSGGPARLVVYRRAPIGSEQMAPILGHYLFEPRRRPVRH